MKQCLVSLSIGYLLRTGLVVGRPEVHQRIAEELGVGGLLAAPASPTPRRLQQQTDRMPPNLPLATIESCLTMQGPGGGAS